MTFTVVAPFTPLIVLGVAALAVMVSIAVKRHTGAAYTIAVVGLALTLATIPVLWGGPPHAAGALLVMDQFSQYFVFLVVAAALLTTLFSWQYVQDEAEAREEYPLLLLLSTLGAGVLVCSRHFAAFFLGLELLSISLYVLIAYFQMRSSSLAAAFKYLVLASVATAFLLFGMALVYAGAGTMQFSATIVPAAPMASLPWMAGIILIVTGVGFKLAVVPFHLWAPDVYDGAPAPVVAFLATVSKGAVFALFLRYMYTAGPPAQPALAILATLAGLSMIAGNVLALLQERIKRILAFSSIAHLGYALVPFTVGGDFAFEASGFYWAAYFVSSLGAFGVLSALARGRFEVDTVAQLEGLAWRRPWLSALFAGVLLSLAGIPLTAGFIGKYYVLAAGVETGVWGLVGLLVLGSVIGLFYYLRILVALFKPVDGNIHEASPQPVGRANGFALGVVAALLIVLGVYPTPLVELLEPSKDTGSPEESGPVRMASSQVPGERAEWRTDGPNAAHPKPMPIVEPFRNRARPECFHSFNYRLKINRL